MTKTLLVTGASSDTGIALLRKIYPHYGCIFAHYCHMSSDLEKLQVEIGEPLHLLQADFTKEEEIRQMLLAIDEIGCVPNHIVHIPAQKTVNQRFHKTTWQEYNLAMETALASIIMILGKYIPHMSRQKYGKIVFMLTAYTLNIPPKYQTPYVVSKYALLGLMKSLAVEYAEKGIMVNGVSPNMMETKFLDDIPDMVKEQSAAKSPLRRILQVEDVVPTFEYLLSDAADTVTGQNIGIMDIM